MAIRGLGPHGERAVPADQVRLSLADEAEAALRRFRIAVVLHTTTSDWSKQELAGIVTLLGQYNAAVVEVVDCAFDIDAHVAALNRLAGEAVDGVISIPIGNARVADAHKALSAAGKKLILLDNAPTGMLPGNDYASVVSTDNFGLGQMGASLLAPHMHEDAVVGILGYANDFFATHEREIAFRKWMADNRPGVRIVRERFSAPDNAGEAIHALLDREPELSALFAVWDVPAMKAVAALKTLDKPLPMTTVDLGHQATIEMASGGMIKGIGAQLPYDQGRAAARVMLLSLLGVPVPPWVALPGRPVTANDAVEAYQVVWHLPAPRELLRLRRVSQR
ncbi:sugar ABC transporter substrate-binding protein [Devosia pacifica]|uniref:Sugar ABC transporter substrate-binding protein n=1 Tax=Devosia pacifica TaxID=1335967 RepID=A0A918VZQ5_9HYPH|nr:substrate-binding domain-containing protein [Devosia pacifica]GHA39290.1 sugar ABC transporter substrate-binding protein [Devosia pacifica]